MSFLGLSAALSFLLALVLGASAVFTPVAALHVVFAVGILPLIFGAMLHFVPVLTRSGAPQRQIAALPFLAQGNGLIVVLAMQGWLPRSLLHAAAGLGLVLAAVLAGWIIRRARRALGSPHPGWRWYAAALVLLMLALLAVPPLVSGLAPAAFRLFHLHANTLGFVGLAALGTLPVLLPTVLGRPDPQAAPWLRRRLSTAVAGVLLLAFGAAAWWPLSLVGGAVLAVLAVSLLAQWWRGFGARMLLADGAAASLVAALVGYASLLLTGAAHAASLAPAAGFVFAFVAAFLLPLVTGALTQLLPVWRFAGPNTPARQEMRRRLAGGGRLRAALFPLAGLAFAIGEGAVAAAIVAFGLTLFVFSLLHALRVPPPAR